MQVLRSLSVAADSNLFSFKKSATIFWKNTQPLDPFYHPARFNEFFAESKIYFKDTHGNYKTKGIFFALRRFRALRPLEAVGDIYFFKDDIALRFNGVGKFWRNCSGFRVLLATSATLLKMFPVTEAMLDLALLLPLT